MSHLELVKLKLRNIDQNINLKAANTHKILSLKTNKKLNYPLEVKIDKSCRVKFTIN